MLAKQGFKSKPFCRNTPSCKNTKTCTKNDLEKLY